MKSRIRRVASADNSEFDGRGAPSEPRGNPQRKRRRIASALSDIKDIVTSLVGIVTVVVPAMATLGIGVVVGHVTAIPPPGGVPNPSGVTNLSDLKPVETSGNVDGPTTGPQQIGTSTYQYSVRFECGYGSGNIVYNVAGFNFLNAIIGVPNDAKSPTGNAMNITFLKDSSTAQQLGSPINVAIGQPQFIHLDLQGATQLELHCMPTNNATHQGATMDFALANATIGPS
jgi:hypothetical protein